MAGITVKQAYKTNLYSIAISNVMNVDSRESAICIIRQSPNLCYENHLFVKQHLSILYAGYEILIDELIFTPHVSNHHFGRPEMLLIIETIGKSSTLLSTTRSYQSPIVAEFNILKYGRISTFTTRFNFPDRATSVKYVVELMSIMCLMVSLYT